MARLIVRRQVGRVGQVGGGDHQKFSKRCFVVWPHSSVVWSSAPGAGAEPKRINRAIELLAKVSRLLHGLPLGDGRHHEAGVKDGRRADYLSYDMEHAPYDIKGLADYMRGLVAGGPTRSGHRTPAVIVNVPVNGTDEATVRANAWMFHQVLATGVHGIMLTHADTPGAVRALVESVRLPIHKQAVGAGIKEGRRGAHGADTAAPIWGVAGRVFRQSRRVAAESQWRAPAWPEARRQVCARQCRRKLEGPGHRVRGMGAGRHGAVAERPGARRGITARDGGGSGQGVRRLQGEQGVLPELDESRQRGGDDSGRRDGRTGEPTGRRDRPTVHQAADALVAHVALKAVRVLTLQRAGANCGRNFRILESILFSCRSSADRVRGPNTVDRLASKYVIGDTQDPSLVETSRIG